MTAALEGGEGSASRPGRSLPPGKTRYPLYRTLGGPQGQCGQVRKILSLTGIRSPDRPARSELLYRLSHPAHFGRTYYGHIQCGSSLWHVGLPPEYPLRRHDPGLGFLWGGRSGICYKCQLPIVVQTSL
jgi:hypothetical protein